MIYGQTNEQRDAEWQVPKKIFAWWPTQLDDGRTVWLEWIEQKWWNDPHENWAGGSSRYRYFPLDKGR